MIATTNPHRIRRKVIKIGEHTETLQGQIAVRLPEPIEAILLKMKATTGHRKATLVKAAIVALEKMSADEIIQFAATAGRLEDNHAG